MHSIVFVVLLSCQLAGVRVVWRRRTPAIFAVQPACHNPVVEWSTEMRLTAQSPVAFPSSGLPTDAIIWRSGEAVSRLKGLLCEDGGAACAHARALWAVGML